MFRMFLIKYAEIGVKGKNRYLFEDALIAQIKRTLRRVEGRFSVTKESGRIYVEAVTDFDFDETVDALKTVFGIVGICPVVLLEDKGYEELSKDVVAYMDHMYPDKHKTFKVQVRRARKNYPMDSMELARELGSDILMRIRISPWMYIIRRSFCRWRSASTFMYIPRSSRDRAVCRWEQTERPCCFCPVVSTVR